jgi:hypothetical protein
MAEIPFTQFLRPDGRQTDVSIDRPDEISTLALRIIDRGYRFECEHLTTGHASFTIAKDGDDHDIEVVTNGPDVPPAIDRLVTRFAKKIGA